MLPDKKRMLVVGLISIGALIGIIFIIYFITLFTKEVNSVGKISDPYPSEVAYFAIKYDNVNNYEKLVPLNKDFEELDYSINSFYKILETKIINGKLVIYSDAINEIAYNSEKDEFYLSEVDPFYNTRTVVKIAKDYVVFLTPGGAIEYRGFYTKELDKNTVVATDITDRNIAVVDNVIYYRDFEGIVSYNIETDEKNIVVPTSENFSPSIVEYNDYYILFQSNDEYMLLEIKSNRITNINEVVSNTTMDLLSLYRYGFVYATYNPNRLAAFNAFFKRLEGSEIILSDNKVVNNMFEISEYDVYMELVNPMDEREYYIYDVNSKEFKHELSEVYEKIIKVNSNES